jgi:ABC-type nickel/cobalt efflux system permease component RcnA
MTAMQRLVDIQHWLYGGMATGLAEVARGDGWALFSALSAAVLFGAVHALMPGHGKTVLVSYHLGQASRYRDGLTNGVILALTHIGLAVVLVLAGFAVISKVFAFGGRTPQFELASGTLIVLIGAFLLWRGLGRTEQPHRHDGKTLAFVTGLIPCPLTTFVMSYALARGMLAAGLTVTAAMAFGMIATIATLALAATFARHRLVSLLARTERLRYRLGAVLEVGSSVALVAFGAWMIANALAV